MKQWYYICIFSYLILYSCFTTKSLQFLSFSYISLHLFGGKQRHIPSNITLSCPQFRVPGLQPLFPILHRFMPTIHYSPHNYNILPHHSAIHGLLHFTSLHFTLPLPYSVPCLLFSTGSRRQLAIHDVIFIAYCSTTLLPTAHFNLLYISIHSATVFRAFWRSAPQKTTISHKFDIHTF